ncbi:alanyl-tRNA editing protein [Candidatus Collierbacteria bacterium]|nr:alanyl-tRNA editing protein [Candidatus Collierbacteria bacterium]
MKTKLLYLDDSYQTSMEAEIVEVDEPSPGRYRVVLDQTVFYPIGGGQATDQGKLVGVNWEGQVQEVVIKDGEVRHFVTSKTPPQVGMKVKGEINWDRRYKLMKIHSGGHIIDFAIYLLGYSPSPLMPYKGDHGKDAFIVYKGVVGKDIRQEVEDKANELVAKKLKITWSFAPLEELQKEAIYLQPGLPTNKPLRKITLEGVGSVADGGTQIKETSEIGRIEVSSITSENGETVVKYRVI